MESYPAVPKSWLHVLAGSIWAAVGILLVAMAVLWLLELHTTEALESLAAGMVITGIVTPLGFMRIARKNIRRIDAYGERVCVFAFQEWRSYLIIIVMMALGWTLRHSGIPSVFLVPVYIGIGGALLGSSVLYWKRLMTRNRREDM